MALAELQIAAALSENVYRRDALDQGIGIDRDVEDVRFALSNGSLQRSRLENKDSYFYNNNSGSGLDAVSGRRAVCCPVCQRGRGRKGQAASLESLEGGGWKSAVASVRARGFRFGREAI
jgi:hypothetical protein